VLKELGGLSVASLAVSLPVIVVVVVEGKSEWEIIDVYLPNPTELGSERHRGREVKSRGD